MEERRERVTIFFEIAARVVEHGRVGLSRGWDLERVGLDDVRRARANAEEIRVGDDTERLVVAKNAGLLVPFFVSAKRTTGNHERKEGR